jgi:hypothetical protein
MEKQILSEEFIRMQRLAGIEIQAQEPILEEILLEAFIEIYCLKNNLLLESLDESLIGKLKDKIKKLNIKPTIGLVASMLKGLKNALTDEGYQKIIKIVKDYDGPKNISQIKDYLIKNLDIPKEKLDEKIFTNKKGNPNTLSRSILFNLIFIILFNLTSSSFLSQAQSSMDKFDAPIEKEISVKDATELELGDSTINALEKISDEVNTPIGGDTGGDTGGDIGNNSVTVDDTGNVIKVGFDTGEFEIGDVDKVAKKVADEIIKKAGGKTIVKIDLEVEGLISNTPGEGDNNPNGPDKTGLAEKRLEVAKKIADEVKLELEKKYSGIKVSIKDGGTNVNNTGEEVEVGSKEAKDKEAASFTILDIETEKETTIDTPDSPLTYFRRPKDLMPDGNKYYTILGYFLPLITNDKQPSKEFMKILNMKEGDVINDSFINKKIEELRTQYPEGSPKVKEAKKAIQILSWAQKVKKNPKSIGEFIKNLDPKINIPWEKRVLLRPGEKGKAAFTGGSKTTQTPTPGSQAQDRLRTGGRSTPNPTPNDLRDLGEIRLANIYENLLFEAQASEWKSLPDYNESTAKSNLGELVPLYVYIWDIGDNGAIKYVSGINDDGSQAKNVPYKLSWEKFTTKYPVLDKKTNDYLFNVKPSEDPKKQGEPSKSSSKSDNIPVKFDKETDKTKNTSETNRIITAINNNSSIKTALSKIDNVEEFKQLILILLLDKLPVYKDNRPALRTALSKIQARIQLRNQKGQFIKLQEEDASDVIRLEDLLDDSAATQLRNELKNINTEEEIIQIIVRAIIPYLNPNLKNSTQSLKQAIIRAQADFDKMSKSSGDIDLKELFVKALRESSSR